MERGPLVSCVQLAARAIAGASCLATAQPSGAQTPTPVGGQFQVNTYTSLHQGYPAVAVDAEGDFVVVWQRFNSSRTAAEVQGQRYASDGTPQGSEFQVNTYANFPQASPSVAVGAEGDFVVVWHSGGSFGTDDDYFSIQGQRYASDGTAQGSEFQVNSFTADDQLFPSVAVDAQGDFVVVWEGIDIQGQRFASDGTPQGSEFQVNTYTPYIQCCPSLASGANGDFVVVWDDVAGDYYGGGIQGQRFASDGTALGSQFQVNTYATYNQVDPSVAAEANGEFVVVWESGGSYGTDTSYDSIQGQRYSSDGTAQDAEFQVNTYTTDIQYLPSVAVEGDGDFVVVWRSTGFSGTDAIKGQRYASDGTALGSEFQVNTYTPFAQSRPSVAADDDGDFVVVWQSGGSFGTDADGLSVQGQRFSVPEPSPGLSRTLAAVVLALLVRGRRSRAHGPE